MPKMRTRRAAAKRFKTTASGKVKIKKAGLRHILEKQASGLKRKKRQTGYVARADIKLVQQVIPYGKARS